MKNKVVTFSSYEPEKVNKLLKRYLPKGIGKASDLPRHHPALVAAAEKYQAAAKCSEIEIVEIADDMYVVRLHYTGAWEEVITPSRFDWVKIEN
jgi:hypothetical protein